MRCVPAWRGHGAAGRGSRLYSGEGTVPRQRPAWSETPETEEQEEVSRRRSAGGGQQEEVRRSRADGAEPEPVTPFRRGGSGGPEVVLKENFGNFSTLTLVPINQGLRTGSGV